MDERDLHVGRRDRAARVVQLALRQVEAHRPRAAPRQDDRPLCRPTAELKDVTLEHVAEDTQLRFRDLPHAPRGAVDRELRPLLRLVAISELVPERAIPPGVR